MQKHKIRHRKLAALLGFKFRTTDNCSLQDKTANVNITKVILFNYRGNATKHSLENTHMPESHTHWKAKLHRFNSCFLMHVSTPLGSSSTDTRLISANILVHPELSMCSTNECWPVKGHKCSTGKLFFPSLINFKHGEWMYAVRSPWDCLTTPRDTIIAQCRVSRKSVSSLKPACVNRAADLLTSHIFIY